MTHQRPATNLAETGGDRWKEDNGRQFVNPHASLRMTTAPDPTKEGVRPRPAFDARVLLRCAGSRTVTYQRSDVIFSQDEASDTIFFIRDGVVKLSVSSRGGKEGVIAMLASGDFFGESALAARRVRFERATAVVTTTVLIIPKQQMIRALHADHTYSDRFIAHMLARNIRMEGDLVDHLLNSSEHRLARALLLLAHRGKPGQVRRVLPRISQTVLAQMVGTTRSRVNFFMKRFKRRGFIDDDGGLTINDSLLKGIGD